VDELLSTFCVSVSDDEYDPSVMVAELGPQTIVQVILGENTLVGVTTSLAPELVT
jgi:hypothetical protein